MKATGITFLAVCLIINLWVYFENCSSKQYKDQVQQLEQRLALANEQPLKVYLHDTIPVYIEKVVEIDKTDYKKVLADKQLIQDLALKINQIEAESKTKTVYHDTVFLKELSDSMWTYKDNWANVTVNARNRELVYDFSDSIITLVSTEYKHHFLFWKWGKKGYNVSIVNFNPHSNITYSKFIKIK